ncbi:MAG: pyridoxamine 5'-phosphate oxidase family protein [Oscillospiraceae bacterium]|nr:pyridoxamine 5'-phosphate oxidase family protein [Oscillospiraceae bacterium]
MQTNLTDRATQLIQQAASVHLAVIDENGYPVVMAMSPTNIQNLSLGEIFMTTTLDSNKAKCLQQNSKASVCCSTPHDNITLVGEIEICTDQATKSKCWQDWFIGPYPGGEADPNYCALKFTTTRYKLFVDGEEKQGSMS